MIQYVRLNPAGMHCIVKQAHSQSLRPLGHLLGIYPASWVGPCRSVSTKLGAQPSGARQECKRPIHRLSQALLQLPCVSLRSGAQGGGHALQAPDCSAPVVLLENLPRDRRARGGASRHPAAAVAGTCLQAVCAAEVAANEWTASSRGP